jgi:hypothetical protein
MRGGDPWSQRTGSQAHGCVAAAGGTKIGTLAACDRSDGIDRTDTFRMVLFGHVKDSARRQVLRQMDGVPGLLPGVSAPAANTARCWNVLDSCSAPVVRTSMIVTP